MLEIISISWHLAKYESGAQRNIEKAKKRKKWRNRKRSEIFSIVKEKK